MKAKVYKLAVSLSPLCTNPIEVFSNDNPKEVDLFSTPDFGSGSVRPGSYPCILIELSDTVKFVPFTEEGVCTAGKEFTYDICGEDRPLFFQLIDGTRGTCMRGEQRIAVYFSTAATTERAEVTPTHQSYLPPTVLNNETSRAWQLKKPLIIDGATESFFLLDGNFQIASINGACIIEVPQFSFKTP